MKVTEIVAAVTNVTGVSCSEMVNATRSKRGDAARQLAVYLSRRKLAMSIPALAETFGGKRASIIRDIRAAESRFEDREFMEQMERVEDSLEAETNRTAEGELRLARAIEMLSDEVRENTRVLRIPFFRALAEAAQGTWSSDDRPTRKLGMRLPLQSGLAGDEVSEIDLEKSHVLICGRDAKGRSDYLQGLARAMTKMCDPAAVRIAVADPTGGTAFSELDESPCKFRPVASTPEACVRLFDALAWHVDRRFERFATKGCKNIRKYNSRKEPEGEKTCYYHIVLFANGLGDVATPAVRKILERGCDAGVHLVVAAEGFAEESVPGDLLRRMAVRVLSKD